MKYVEGNLVTMALEGQFDVIVHGCNIFHTFGSGIAAEIRDRIPEAYAADLQSKLGDKSKLGTYTMVGKDIETNRSMVINLYTQGSFGKKGVHVVYDAVERGFTMIAAAAMIQERITGQPVKVGIPMIGAGLGGGDWNKIVKIIDDCGFSDITCVVMPGSEAAKRFIVDVVNEE